VRNVLIGLLTGILVGIIIGGTAIMPGDNDAALKPSPPPALKAAATNPETPAQTTWRMASAYSLESGFPATLARRFARMSLENSNGAFNIQLAGPGELIQPGETLNAVRAGAIEAAFFTPGLRAANNPGLHLFSGIPFGPAAPEFLSWFYGGDGQKYYDELSGKQGIKAIICGLQTPRSSGRFKSPLTSVNDLKSMSYSIQGLGARVLGLLGATPVDIPDSDLFQAFSKNIISAAQPQAPNHTITQALNKVAPYYYVPGWQQPVELFELIINGEKWQSLSAIDQSRLMTMCGDNVRYSIAFQETESFGRLKSLVDQGVQIRRLPDDIIKQLKNAWQQVAKEEKNTAFQKILKSLNTFREEYSIWKDIGAL